MKIGVDFSFTLKYYICVSKKGGDKLGSQRGRPTDNPKMTEIKVRATYEDKRKLQYCCNQTGKTQYQIVMEGIDRIYEELEKEK